MAKESKILAGLKRLFSTTTIVKNIGKKELKIIDTDSSKSSPKDLLYKQFRGMYKQQYGQFGQSYNFKMKRDQLYLDYESMDSDPILSSALDIYADESTLLNEYGDLITIDSTDENIQRILENLFYDILNLKFNLWSWIRTMCKYGDAYILLNINPNVGIDNFDLLSSYEVEREEALNEEGVKRIQFIIEGNRREPIDSYRIAHFRLINDSNFLPYGKSMLEPARKIWKQLCLLEDAMLVHRITRSTEKRVFKVDVGAIPSNQVEQFMQKTKDEMKRAPLVDPTTGEYNLKYNVENMTEDFFLPVRGNSNTDISTVGELRFDATDDIEYIRNKMMAALKIPKSFLGYEEEVNAKATLAGEDLRFARTIERLQKFVASEITKIALIHLYIQGYRDADLVNFNLGLTASSIVYEQQKIELWDSKIRIAESLSRDVNLLPRKWVYDNVFKISEEEQKELKKELYKDSYENYRYSELNSSGEDPGEDPSIQGAEDDEDDEKSENKLSSAEEINKNSIIEQDLRSLISDDEDVEDDEENKKKNKKKNKKNKAIDLDDLKNILKVKKSDVKHTYKGGSALSLEKKHKF